MKQYNKSIKNKLFNYFKQRLGLKKSTKGYWRTNCPYCGGNYTFGINLEQRKAHCFKCEETPTPIELVIYLEQFENIHQVYNLLNLQEEYESYDNYISKQELIVQRPVELPESFQLLIQGDSIMGKCARNYMTKRKFDLTRLSLKGVGYCTEGEYAGYIIFPIYKQGKLVFFQGRRFMESAGPKMKNPREEDFGIGKSKVIYNSDALFIYKKVYLVESITNAETLGDNAIAILGKIIDKWQLSPIIASPCEEITIILDEDAWEYAIGLAMQLANYKRIKLIRMPEEKDVNDIGRKETKKLEKRAQYLNYSDLFRLKLNDSEIERAKN